MKATAWATKSSTTTFSLATARVKKIPLDIPSVDYHTLQNTSVPMNSGPTDKPKSYYHFFLKARQSASSPPQTPSLYFNFCFKTHCFPLLFILPCYSQHSVYWLILLILLNFNLCMSEISVSAYTSKAKYQTQAQQASNQMKFYSILV